MLALSILQPWALTILRERKLIENRTWRRSVTGRVLVHAGKKYDIESEPFIIQTCFDIFGELPNVNVMRSADRGALLGVMSIRTCVAPLEAMALDPKQAP